MTRTDDTKTGAAGAPAGGSAAASTAPENSSCSFSTLGRQKFTNPTILLEDGSNFLSWKVCTEFLLRQEKDCWEATTGKVTPSTEDEAATARFNKANEVAKAIILGTIHPNLMLDLFYGTVGTETCATSWQAICSKFAKQTGILKHQVMTSFMGYRYNPSESPSSNITRFKSILHRLLEVKVTIDNAMTCAKMIDALPDSWEGLKLSWGSRSEAKQLPNLLYDMIIAEASRRDEKNMNQTEAFFSKMKIGGGRFRRNRFNRKSGKPGSNRGRGRPHSQNTASSQNDITCYRCNRKGHTKWNCRSKPISKNNVAVNNAEAFLALHSDLSVNKANRFVVDSGSSAHIVQDKRWFVSYEKFVTTRVVKLGGSKSLQAEGSGTIRLTVCGQDHTVEIELKDVLFVPRMRRNLISVSKLSDEGYTVICDQNGLTISDGETTIKTDRENDLYLLSAEETVEKGPQSGECLIAKIGPNTPKVSLMLAHKALGHTSKKKVIETLDRANIKYTDDMTTCDACIQGKQHRATYRSKPEKALAQSKGYCHADLCTAPVDSLGGNKYFLCITDEYSKYRAVYFLKTKTAEETAEAI